MDFASPAINQPPPSASERERIRDLNRYLGKAAQPSLLSPEVADNLPSLSKDIVLNGLTKLGVLRFGCDRSFVSLIDGHRQHILAESTASISLRDRTKHRPNNGIYLGVSTLDLAFGVCPQAVKLFTGQPVYGLRNSANMTADKDRFIVRDFTLEEGFRERPYVAEWPFFRFYAEVPIYSPSGYVIGSYCCVDNVPRHSFTDDDVAALQEISDSISAHLENVRTVRYHRRSDNLVHALTTFVKDRPGHGVSSPSLTTHDEERGGLVSSPVSMPDLLSHEREPSVDSGDASISGFATSPSSLGKASSLTRMTSLSSQSQPPYERSEKPATEKKETHLASDSTPLVVVKETVAVSRRIAAIFSDASALLRESMQLDGVLFLDASRCNSGIASAPDSTDWEPFPKTADPMLSRGAPRHLPSLPYSETICDSLGSSLDPSSQNSSQPAIQTALLQQLVSAFPRGEVFHLGDEDNASATSINSVQTAIEEGPSGECDRDSRVCHQTSIMLQLHRYFPQAKSVVFLPLWDLDKAQWLAGTFIWSADPERALGLEELHYFRVFGDSIISEVARVNWAKEERSKSSFVSSISHELRSPLHGILASTELLSSTALQAEQQGIVKMLETCGMTLLDTMNHLLDFTKINNLTTLKEGDDTFHKKAIANLESAFKLDTLLESVVQTMVIGSGHAKLTPSSFTAPSVSADGDGADRHRDLSVVLRIDEHSDDQWGVRSNTGAWRRLIMNLLGNALKYTSDGFIEVSLSKIKMNMGRPSMEAGSGERFVAHLSVTDSGRGMSPEFVRNKSFTPFVQEDHLNDGVGLGLSFVKKLVTLLDGSIDLRSELGVGTQVDVFIPLESVVTDVPSADATITPSTPEPPTRFCLVGFGADLAETSTGMLSSESKRRLCIQSFFSQLVNNQPGWSVTFAESLADASGDVAILEPSTLDQSKARGAGFYDKFKRYLVLDNAAVTVSKGAEQRAHMRLSQPYCPHKALEALREMAKPDNVRFEVAATGMPSPPETPSLSKPLPQESNAVTSEPTQHVLLPKARAVDTTESRGKSPHVLIIDDNSINVKVLSVFMRKLGWTYDTASNGLIALNKYKEAPASFDVLLMDISMPIMDGIISTRHIRSFEKEHALRPVSIFAITGVGSTTTRQQALSAGMNEYLIKPLSLKQLQATLKDV